MIIENPYHRRKVKAILQENVRLKAELSGYSELKEEKDIVDAELLSKEIEFLKKQVFDLKQKIQGYKMQNSKLRKKLRS